MRKYQKPTEVKISFHCDQLVKEGYDTLQLIETMISNNYSISRTSIIDDNTIEYIFTLNKDKKKRIENIFDRFGAILDELKQEIEEREEKNISDELKNIISANQTSDGPFANTLSYTPLQVTCDLDKK